METVRRMWLSGMLCSVILTSVAIAGEDPIFTAGSINGRAWHNMTDNEKLYYAAGFMDGVVQGTGDTRDAASAECRQASPQSSQIKARYLSPRASLNELRMAVDGFYGDPANIAIPIFEAFRMTVKQAAGVSAAAIDYEVRILRKLAAADWTDPAAVQGLTQGQPPRK
jgi:hypothetical protein